MLGLQKVTYKKGFNFFLKKDSKEIYGSHRIQKMLDREGLKYCRSYIGLLMKEMGLKSVLKRKFVVTTGSGHVFPIVKNVLNRDFDSLRIRGEMDF